MQPSDFPSQGWNQNSNQMEESKSFSMQSGPVLQKTTYKDEFPTFGKTYKAEPSAKHVAQ